MLKQRFVEVLINENWEVRTYAAVKEGMTVRIIDIDGSLVLTPDGKDLWYAISDAYKIDDGYEFDCIPND